MNTYIKTTVPVALLEISVDARPNFILNSLGLYAFAIVLIVSPPIKAWKSNTITWEPTEITSSSVSSIYFAAYVGVTNGKATVVIGV